MKIDIRYFLSQILDGIRNYFRIVTKMPGFRVYVILLPLVILLFLVLTFPYDVIILRSLRSADGRMIRNLSMNELDAPLVGLWKARFISASLPNNTELNIREANLDLSLIRSIAGRYVGGLQISGTRISSSLFSADMNGSCNFDLTSIDKASVPVNGDVRIILDALQLKIGTINLPDNMGGLSIDVPPCRIDALNARMELKGSRITLKELTLTGKDLKGNVTGYIEAGGGTSTCDLTISVDPESAVLTKFQPFLGGFKNSSGKIEFTLTGPLSRPRIVTDRSGGGDEEEKMDTAPEGLPGLSPVPGQPDVEDEE